MNKRALYDNWVDFLLSWKTDIDDIANVLEIESIYDTVFANRFDSVISLFFQTFNFTEDMEDWFYDMLWSPDSHTSITVEDIYNHAWVNMSVDFDDFYKIFIGKEALN